MNYSFLNKNDDSFTNYLCKFEDTTFLSTFFLKTNTNSIKKIKNNMILSTKNISYFSKNYSALLLLFKFADNDNLIYGRWFNYSNEIDKEHLELMLFQKEIPIIIIDTSTNENFNFYAPNDFSNGIKEHIKKSKKNIVTDNDFSVLVTSLEENINTLSKLWNSIEA